MISFSLQSQLNESSHVTMEILAHYTSEDPKLDLMVHTMIDLVRQIDGIHDRYEQYIQHYDPLEVQTFENFARGVVDDSPLSVQGILPRLQSLMIGHANTKAFKNRGLMEMVASSIKESYGDLMCKNQRTPQQVLYELYNAINLAELKGYAMMQFSYMLLRAYGKGES